MGLALSVVLFWSLQASDELEVARGLVRQARWPQALAALQKAEHEPSLNLERQCAVLELEGEVLATLKRPADAVEAFKRLLSLAPQHRFASARAPKVMTPYLEARDWLQQNGPLRLELEGGAGEDKTLSLRDPLGLVKRVEVRLLEDGVPRVLNATASALPLTLRSPAAALEVSARSLGGDGQALVELAPQRFDRPLAPPPAPVSKVTPRQPPAEVVPAVTQAPRFFTGARKAGAVFIGVAVVAAAVGTAFGIRSRQDRDQLDAERALSKAGGISSLSAAQALTLSNQSVQSAWIANFSFGGAGAFALTGLLLMLFGSDAGGAT